MLRQAASSIAKTFSGSPNAALTAASWAPANLVAMKAASTKPSVINNWKTEVPRPREAEGRHSAM